MAFLPSKVPGRPFRRGEERVLAHLLAQRVQGQRTPVWYRTKTDPSTLDMLLTLREDIHTSRINPTTPGHAAPEQKPDFQVNPERAAS